MIKFNNFPLAELHIIADYTATTAPHFKEDNTEVSVRNPENSFWVASKLMLLDYRIFTSSTNLFLLDPSKNLANLPDAECKFGLKIA